MKKIEIRKMKVPKALKLFSVIILLTAIAFRFHNDLIGLLAVLAIYIIVIGAIITNRVKRKKLKIQALRTLPAFTAHELFISCNRRSGIAIDKDTKQIAYVNRNNKTTVYAHTDLIESEILQDSQSVLKMSAGRTVGGRFVSGAASARRQTAITEVKQIQLKITVNDLNTPALTIVFMKRLMYSKTTGWEGEIYQENIDKANRWHDMISVLIQAADKEVQEKLITGQSSIVQAASNQTQDSYLLADELSKLHSLMEKGILTEAEFSAQKAKLLG